MKNLPVIILGKRLSHVSKLLNRGNGSTWPGHIALSANPHFIKDVLANSKTKIILVAGTNGKTTTAALIRAGLEKYGKTVLQNDSGANLLNGIASTILLNTTASGKLTQDFALFEIDENALPGILLQLTPDYLILLNLFRDQLDRYGEINTIIKKWQEAILVLPEKTQLLLNCDDAQIAYIGIRRKKSSSYFGVQNEEKKTPSQQAADTLSCPKCAGTLTFSEVTFSHLGRWHCQTCGLTRPAATLSEWTNYPLPGTYNKYNTHAAVLTLTQLGMNNKDIHAAFSHFKPAFGRQEIVTYKGKKVQLFLSKNPTSFTESYRTILELKGKTLLIVLNDRIPDGRDVSWIWDVNLTGIENFTQILLAGDRVYDLALRIKYAEYKNFKTYDSVRDAVQSGIELTGKDETLYVLPTYSAMLEVRKILTGKKIL